MDQHVIGLQLLNNASCKIQTYQCWWIEYKSSGIVQEEEDFHKEIQDYEWMQQIQEAEETFWVGNGVDFVAYG